MALRNFEELRKSKSFTRFFEITDRKKLNDDQILMPSFSFFSKLTRLKILGQRWTGGDETVLLPHVKEGADGL